MRIGHRSLVLRLLLVIGLTGPLRAWAHDREDDHSHPALDHAQARAFLIALEQSRAEITVKNGYRLISSNGLPDHETGRFPNRGNPNSIKAQDYSFKVPVKPKEAHGGDERSRRAGGPVLFGVALNGVVFDPGTAEWWNDDRRSGWNYEAIGGAINLGIDSSNAHVQPTGAYHYHGIPNGLVKNLAGNQRDEQMTLVGWAADGYPVYAEYGYKDAANAKSAVTKLKPSYRVKKGDRLAGDDGPGGQYDGTFTADFDYVEGLGDLDACNGREGVTPEFPDGTYYYVLTESFPQIPRRFHGEPDDSFTKQRGGPGGPGAPGGPGGPGGPGRGPGGGSPDGHRRPPPPPGA